jgi:Cytidylate kinase-like family
VMAPREPATDGRHPRVPPVVTLAAYYGAGGHVVGPRVAERLGVAFLDRGILRAVAERMRLPEEAAEEYDEQRQEPRGIGRFLESLGRVPGPYGTAVDDLHGDEARYRSETEGFLARASTSGGVLLGRGGMVVLRSVPHALHVMLGGPREARVTQAMILEGIDRSTAERRQDAHDRARVDYVRRLYGVDPDDPHLFHLRIDSTAVDLDTCVEVIVAASRSRATSGQPERTP